MLSSDTQSRIEDHQNLLNSHLLPNLHEDNSIHPDELSGDQNGEATLTTSIVGSSKANFLFTVTTIIKTVIGSGIVAIPYTMQKMGYLLGILVFIMAGLMVQFGSVLLLKAKNLSHHSNYSTIFYEIWKSKIAKSIGPLSIFLSTLGVCIAELIIFKTGIRKILEDVLGNSQVLDHFYTQGYAIVLIITLLEVPFSFVVKIEKLKTMALIGVTGITTFVVTFIIFYVIAALDSNPLNNPKGSIRMFPDNWFEAAATVPNVLLSVAFQLNFFPIFKGMKDATDKKMANAVAWGMSFCVCCYLVMGIMGYHYVGNNVSPNFLESLSYDKISKPFFFILNFSFLVSIFFAFCLMFFSCRDNFIALVKLALVSEKAKDKRDWGPIDNIQHISSYIQETNRAEKRRKAKLHFLVYTVILFVFIAGVALGVDSIESVFNVVGALCSSSVCVLLPCLFYFRLVVLKKQPKGWKYYLSIAMFAIIAPYCLFSIVALYVHVS